MKDYSKFDKKIVKILHYNYQQAVSDGRECWGENWITAEIGVDNVISIHEHMAQGEGDRFFYDIVKHNNVIERTFNPCRVFYIVN